MTRPGSGDHASGLYAGIVTHTRFRPRAHRLRYRIFMMLFDLDELPRLGRALHLFSYNRPGLLSFHDRDHLAGGAEGLRAQVEAALAGAGLELGGGPIRVLCMPRVLGFVFNPISVYFCHRPDESLAAILYEVNNTFGQRHTYLIPVDGPVGPVVAQTCDKRFFVSPFMQMDLRYRFKVRPPAREAGLVVDGSDGAGPMIAAAFHGRRGELSDRGIANALLAHPLMTLGVVAAIHWEALKLFLKGVGLKPRPPAPDAAVTVVR